jgi:hypothetical protein
LRLRARIFHFTRERKKTMANPAALPKNMPAPAAKKPASLKEFGQRYQNVNYPVLAGLLILLAAGLVYLLLAKTFTNIFKCRHLAGPTFDSLCTGIGTPRIPILPNIDLWGHHILDPVEIPAWTILPGVEGAVNPPLEALRKFIVSNIILAFAVASLILAFIVIKFKDFITAVRTSAGRKKILTNLSIFLFIFALFCSLFYFRPGQ